MYVLKSYEGCFSVERLPLVFPSVSKWTCIINASQGPKIVWYSIIRGLFRESPQQLMYASTFHGMSSSVISFVYVLYSSCVSKKI